MLENINFIDVDKPEERFIKLSISEREIERYLSILEVTLEGLQLQLAPIDERLQVTTDKVATKRLTGYLLETQKQIALLTTIIEEIKALPR